MTKLRTPPIRHALGYGTTRAPEITDGRGTMFTDSGGLSTMARRPSLHPAQSPVMPQQLPVPRPQIVCANLVLEQRGLLLVKESKPTALGRWSLPAGRLEVGESLRDGAAREALEETGLSVQVGSLLGIYHCLSTLEGGAAVNFVFRSTVLAGATRVSSSHPEVAFVSRDEVEDLLDRHLIRGQHVRLAIAAAENGLALPDDLVTEIPASPAPQT